MVEFVGIRPKEPDGVWQIVPDKTPLDLERFGKIRRGMPFLVTVKFKRNLKHHRWYWGLVGVVAEGIGMQPEALHAQLKFKADAVRSYFLHEGKIIVDLKSEAFDQMDEIEFTEFRQVAVEIIFRDYLATVRRKDVWRRVEEIVGPCPW